MGPRYPASLFSVPQGRSEKKLSGRPQAPSSKVAVDFFPKKLLRSPQLGVGRPETFFQRSVRADGKSVVGKGDPRRDLSLKRCRGASPVLFEQFKQVQGASPALFEQFKQVRGLSPASFQKFKQVRGLPRAVSKVQTRPGSLPRFVSKVQTGPGSVPRFV